ncbi:MAG: hypothetical protein RL320_1750 [Pseudomonadota bacterium]
MSLRAAHESLRAHSEGARLGPLQTFSTRMRIPIDKQNSVLARGLLLCGLFLAPSWSGAATFACLYESGGGVAWEGFSRSIQEFPPRRPFFITESHLTPEAAAVAMNSSNTFVCAKRRASATYCTSDRGETIAFDPLAAKGLVTVLHWALERDPSQELVWVAVHPFVCEELKESVR